MKEKKLSGEAVRAQLSRTLALAGCDCSERANAGKVFPPSAPFFFVIFRNFRSLPSAGASCPPRDDELSFSAQGRRDDEARVGFEKSREVDNLGPVKVQPCAIHCAFWNRIAGWPCK